MATPSGLEPLTYRLGICRSIHLSYGAVSNILRQISRYGVIGKAVVYVLMSFRWIICFSLIVMSVSVAPAALAANVSHQPTDHAFKLTKGEMGIVARVIDGDSFVLESGLRVSLYGIQAPKPAWPKDDKTAWPMAEEATTALKTLIVGKQVQLYYNGDKRDRYGRALAQVWRLDEKGVPGLWLQNEMIDQGLARVYTWPGHLADVNALYQTEIAARAKKLGIWSKAGKTYYDVRKPDPNPLAQYVDSVQIVEGYILSTADVRGNIYLNFGSDYKTDFTIGVPKRAKRAFKKAEIDPVTLTGAKVRIRGWVELYNGPMMWVSDPQRLEILD